MRSAAAATGLAMLGLAVFLASGTVRAAAIVGVPAVLLSLRPGLRWPAAATAGCMAALMTAASDRGGLAEGLLVLGYLLLLDSIEKPRTRPLPTAAAALAGSAVVALALALPPAPRPYLVLAGLAAIAAGYAIAVPRSGEPTNERSGRRSRPRGE